jgi:hypothetical protein
MSAAGKRIQLKSFQIGLGLGLAGAPQPSVEEEETDYYIHNQTTQTLTIKDESGLSFGFSWDTLQMDVEVKQ